MDAILEEWPTEQGTQDCIDRGGVQTTIFPETMREEIDHRVPFDTVNEFSVCERVGIRKSVRDRCITSHFDFLARFAACSLVVSIALIHTNS